MAITRKELHALYEKEKTQMDQYIRQQILTIKTQVLCENAAGKKKLSFPIPNSNKYNDGKLKQEFLRLLPEYFVDCKITTEYKFLEMNYSCFHITIDWS
jgi:hypothetical protein